MGLDLKHYGVKGMKWGVRKDPPPHLRDDLVPLILKRLRKTLKNTWMRKRITVKARELVVSY